MTVWKAYEGGTFEYFEREIEPEALPGFEDLVQLWKGKRKGRIVPAWSDFDVFDFKGWHGNISVYEISYDPFDYSCILSGVEVDGVFGRTMTGVKGSELAEARVEHPASMAFYEMASIKMKIVKTQGGLNIKGREHINVTFVGFPLSDDGLRSTHTLEALICSEKTRA
ncbi:MAG: hypothetical protein R3245_08805 [Kiloniellales bacterium]|nr:hypothetical protein [Kiloniellales bacterium]